MTAEQTLQQPTETTLTRPQTKLILLQTHNTTPTHAHESFGFPDFFFLIPPTSLDGTRDKELARAIDKSATQGLTARYRWVSKAVADHSGVIPEVSPARATDLQAERKFVKRKEQKKCERQTESARGAGEIAPSADFCATSARLSRSARWKITYCQMRCVVLMLLLKRNRGRKGRADGISNRSTCAHSNGRIARKSRGFLFFFFDGGSHVFILTYCVTLSVWVNWNRGQIASWIFHTDRGDFKEIFLIVTPPSGWLARWSLERVILCLFSRWALKFVSNCFKHVEFLSLFLIVLNNENYLRASKTLFWKLSF